MTTTHPTEDAPNRLFAPPRPPAGGFPGRPALGGRRGPSCLAGGAIALAAFVALGCGGGAPAGPTGPRVVELKLPGAPEEGRSGPVLGPQPILLWEAVQQIEGLAKDDEVRGLFLRPGPLAGAWARTAEIQAALGRFREQGKPVHCHFETMDNVGYSLLAESCDRLTMTPAGDLSLVGVAAQLFYLERLLSDAGIQAEILEVGAYKGGADPFTERSMPEAVRQNLGRLLDDQQALLIDAVSAGRKLDRGKVAELIDQGPFGSGRAKGYGLVDDVVFADGARERLRKDAGVDQVATKDLRPKPDEVGLTDLLRALAGDSGEQPATGARVAVVHLTGQIVDGDDENLGDAVASGPFVRALKKFRDDPQVKAVVLRIASPGGSALASDVMWHAVKSLAQEKPVIASLGDLTASGGYYIAVAADEIVAQPGTVVGSIGVFGGKVVAQDLAQEWGINVETLSRGSQAAWLSPFTPWSDGDRARLRRMLQETYDRFIRRVVDGREAITPDNVARVAQGRVFAGRTAVDNGLVDRLGGFEDAVATARERGGLPADAPVEHWPPARGLLEALAGNVQTGGADARGAIPGAAFLPWLEEAGVPAPALAGMLAALARGEGVVLMPPFALELR